MDFIPGVTMSRMSNEEAPCCLECFSDLVIRENIRDSGENGDCPRCGAAEVKIVSPGDLTELFEPVVSLYMVSAIGVDRLPDEDPLDRGRTLLDCLEQDLGPVFSERLFDRDGTDSLFDDIVNYQRRREHPKDREELDVTDMWVPQTDELTHRSPESLWETFVYHLQHERRFIPDDSDWEIIPPKDWLPEFLEELVVTLDGNSDWFRCRDVVKHSKGVPSPLSLSEMGAPPPELATAGRANPAGISYLYLASDQVTSVAEKRVPKGQTVSVAGFSLRFAVNVIDLMRVPYLDSPFGKQEYMLPFLVERVGVVSRLADELAKPVDPMASEVDYLPTQYLTEMIRSLGYDGLLFKSAMSSGKNLVLFDPEKALASSVSLFKVSDVQYSIEHVVG